MNDIRLIKAKLDDSQLVHEMQREAFMLLYERYRDDDTSPAKESLERVEAKITAENSEFFIIYMEDEAVGAVRVRTDKIENTVVRRISPIFILPKYQDKGLGTMVMKLLFDRYPNTDKWSLDTILQEAMNCHFYEKLGFVRTGGQTAINERMTIVEYEMACR